MLYITEYYQLTMVPFGNRTFIILFPYSFSSSRPIPSCNSLYRVATFSLKVAFSSLNYPHAKEVQDFPSLHRLLSVMASGILVSLLPRALFRTSVGSLPSVRLTPRYRMFCAAFTSLSCCVLHTGHTHCFTPSTTD